MLFRNFRCRGLLFWFNNFRILSWLGNPCFLARLCLSTTQEVISQNDYKSIKRYRIKDNYCYLGEVLKAGNSVCDESPEEERAISWSIESTELRGKQIRPDGR